MISQLEEKIREKFTKYFDKKADTKKFSFSWVMYCQVSSDEKAAAVAVETSDIEGWIDSWNGKLEENFRLNKIGFYAMNEQGNEIEVISPVISSFADKRPIRTYSYSDEFIANKYSGRPFERSSACRDGGGTRIDFLDVQNYLVSFENIEKGKYNLVTFHRRFGEFWDAKPKNLKNNLVDFDKD